MNFNLDIPKMGYFLLVSNKGGWFGRNIEKMQRKAGYPEEACRYTHVEILGGGPDSMRIGPPRSRRVDITKVYKGRYVRIVKYDNSQYLEGKRYKVAYFAATLCNLGYDWRGCLRFIIKWIGHSKTFVFCSEGSAWALKKVFPGFQKGKNPEDFYPADFLNKKYFQVEWEGVIR